jgi:hypothetical protein
MAVGMPGQGRNGPQTAPEYRDYAVMVTIQYNSLQDPHRRLSRGFS